MNPISQSPAFTKGFSPSLASVFAHTLCVSCLIFQRFGVTLGSGSQLFACLLIVPVAFLGMVLVGQARVRAEAAAFFLIAAVAGICTTFLAILYPDFAFRFSLLSLEETGLIYAFFILGPTERCDTSVVLKVFIFWTRLISASAIIQYGLQFAGLRVFSFHTLHIPDAVLMESSYHVVAPITYGSSILRANGFFLLEPSILSQVMALAIIVDAFVLRRYRFLPLYGLAILASFSGTGPLILLLSLICAGLLSPRQIPRVVALLLLAGVGTVTAAVIFPEQFATLRARATGADPSAQARYLEQLNVLDTIRNDPRLLLGFGPGATEGYVRLGTASAGLKLLFDYGITGLGAFLIFIGVALWNSNRAIMCLAGFLTLQLGGGYLLFPPMVFLLVLLCVWSDERPTLAAMRSRRPWAHDRSTASP